MTGARILMGRIKGRPAAARMLDGALDDLLIDPPTGIPRPGSIFRGAISRPLKGIGGRFVRLPGQTGFLRHAAGHPEGAPLLVQVTGYAEPGKAVPVTTRLLFKSRYVIATPDNPGVNLSRTIRDEAARERLLALAGTVDLPEGVGLILRTEAAVADSDALIGDIAETVDRARGVLAAALGGPKLLLDGPTPDHLAWRDWAGEAGSGWIDGPDAFETHGIIEAVEALAGSRVGLPGGAWIEVEPTRALVAVDVNTGPDTSPAAALKANIAAARALPRALRLRGLGGQIVVDFAPMPKKDRRTLDQVLTSAFRADSVETALVGWTTLGLVELSRKRDRLPLTEAGL
jgi:Ribonuclease G/E